MKQVLAGCFFSKNRICLLKKHLLVFTMIESDLFVEQPAQNRSDCSACFSFQRIMKKRFWVGWLRKFYGTFKKCKRNEQREKLVRLLVG